MSTSHSKRSDSRLMVGAVLSILTSICFLVVIVQLFASLVPPVASPTLRQLIGLLVSIALLLCASAVLRDRSVLWQVPLQAFAASALIVSVKFLVEAAFQNPHWLVSAGAVVCVGYLVVGLAAAWLMRTLQRRLI